MFLWLICNVFVMVRLLLYVVLNLGPYYSINIILRESGFDGGIISSVKHTYRNLLATLQKPKF